MDYIFLIMSHGESGSPSILNASRTLKMLRLTKFLSLMRLLRVSRLMRYANQWQEVSSHSSALLSEGSFSLFSSTPHVFKLQNFCLMKLLAKSCKIVHILGIIDLATKMQDSHQEFQKVSHSLLHVSFKHVFRKLSKNFGHICYESLFLPEFDTWNLVLQNDTSDAP